MNDEKKLINRCKNGDYDAQKILFEKYSRVMMGICMRYVKDKYAAEDIMQDGFIVIYTKIGQYKGLGSFEGWMKRIMINLSLKYLKNKSKNYFYEIGEIEQTSNLLNSKREEEQNVNIDFGNIKSVILNTEISQHEIFDAVAELPDGFRTVFNLYSIEGYKHKEIAKELGISINTSKTQLLRARKQLQKKLYKVAIEKHKAQNIKFYKEVI